MDIIQKKETMS